MVASEADALDAMQSLGLRWRAENIIAVARALLDDFGGVVPDTELELRSLPGVGDYVAQAVLCFAFDRRAVLMDTNTSRIVGRYQRHTDTRRWQLRLDLYGLAGPRGPDAEFNYALLDLGALICRAGSPRCEVCPVAENCATRQDRPPARQLELAP
jgi:A/G-specific adenine glycosylase